MPEIQSSPCFLTPKRFNPDYPLFIFLPGMDGTGELLRSQTEGLESAFDVRCLAIPADDLNSWEVLTEKVVELIKLEVGKHSRRSVYLCGESFGGCLAMKVALHSPDLFDRIVLINPASSFNQRAFLSWGAQLSSWVPDFIYKTSAIALLPFLCALGRTSPSDRRALLDAMRSVPPKTVTWRLSLLNDFDIEPDQLQQITPPVLVMAGGSDRMLPSVWEARRLTHYLPNAQMLVLPECGHACLLEMDVHLYDILKAQNFLEADTVKEGMGTGER